MNSFSSALIGVTALSVAHGLAGAAERAARIRFQAHWPVGLTVPCPASFDLPEVPPAGQTLGLFALNGEVATPVPCQPDPIEARRVWYIAIPPAAGTTQDYEVRPGGFPAAAVVVAAADETTLHLTLAGKPVLAYRYAPMPPPEGTSPLFVRSAFIHPVYSPEGEVLTAIHPADHTHHVGLWNPWTSTEFEGRHVDFWNLAAGEGTVRFVAFETVTSGPVFGGFRAVQHHVDLKAPGGEKVVLEEIFDVRVWNVPSASFVVDVTSTQRCASDSPLLLNAYRYGGLGFRGRLGWNTGNSDYLSSEGKTRLDGHASRARWCHAYGDTPAGGAGILFMSHPQNREFPEPMRLWPADANNGKDNMFFNYCPVQQTPWTLTPGNTYTLSYRLQVYSGKPEKEAGEAQWKAFATPPEARPLTVE